MDVRGTRVGGRRPVVIWFSALRRRIASSYIIPAFLMGARTWRHVYACSNGMREKPFANAGHGRKKIKNCRQTC